MTEDVIEREIVSRYPGAVDEPRRELPEFEEFCRLWDSGEIPVWQQARWLAGAGIPVMAKKRQRLLREARERLGLPSSATEVMIVYEELRQRSKEAPGVTIWPY
jgi:hypothetical protein